MIADTGLDLIDELRAHADRISAAILAGAPRPVQYALVMRDEVGQLLVLADHTSDLLAVLRNLTAGAATVATTPEN
jgi:hypothetical protein